MKKFKQNPWSWIPSLYFAEGLPYVIVNTLSIIFYKRMGVSNSDIAFFTSVLNAPWVLKIIISPFVEILKTKRWWIILTQFLIAICLAIIALLIFTNNYFYSTLTIFWLMALSSATHDIAADGFYMLGLSKHDQAFFVGIRSTFYRLAMITGQGILVIIAGYFETKTQNIKLAWSIVFIIVAIIFIIISIYHNYILPKPFSDIKNDITKNNIFNDFTKTFVEFFKIKQIGLAILFLFIYRLGESQLVRLATPFLLDGNDANGLGLSTSEIGLIYGTIGVIALVLGGILGGIAISRKGLKYWILWMAFAMNAPNLIYIYLSSALPNSLWIVGTSVAIEQLGYGFGFTAYLMYMIYISQGNFKTSHYAYCTVIMALGVMLPGMISGWLQEMIGYKNFFIWVMLCTIPGFALIPFLKIDADFGKKG